MRKACLLLATLALLANSSALMSDPKPGFVTVIGSAVSGVNHADRGAPVQVQSIALKNSGAELGYCNILSASVLDPLLASGREIAAYVHRGTSSSTGTWLYGKGVRHFIFENEPDGNLPDYMSVLPAAYSVIHGFGPLARVIAGNCFNAGSYVELYTRGFKNCSDMVGFHNYSDDPATGLDINAVETVHATMQGNSDGGKPMYLGEGWGPKREIRTCPRIHPAVQPTLAELQAMRGFVVNGWRNLTTSQAGGYQPSWVYGALFFTLSDNWGENYANFYNGGLIDLYGNPKDDLLLLFPGNKLTIANCGFEYFSQGNPMGVAPFWQSQPGTLASCYGVDASVRRAGARSQRIEVAGTPEAYICQTTESGSVAASQQYTFSAWGKAQGVTGGYSGARVGIQFLTSAGASVGAVQWSPGLMADSDWTQMQVTAMAPAGAARCQVYCDLHALAGRAWFDDCAISAAASPQTGSIEGYVLDNSNNAIAGATVTVQPGGADALSDATGRFFISGVGPGACEMTATKQNFSRKTVSRVAVAPSRTSVAGLHLQGISSQQPGNVQVYSPDVSGLLKISWERPTDGADSYRVYRSTTQGSLGTRIADGLASLTLWDQGLTDYQPYYYTVHRVLGGSESTNGDSYAGVPTAGPANVAYAVSEEAGWSNWSTLHGQTFVATKTGALVSATCTLATAGAPTNRTMTFSIRDGGISGPQIGPSRQLICYSDQPGTARWSGGEVPVVEGHTYCLRLDASSGTAIYRTVADVYAGGRYYMGANPYSANVDLWSTITIADNAAPDVLNVSAANTGPAEVTVTWQSSAPTTGQVEYGALSSYGQWSTLDSTLSDTHSAVLTVPNAGNYHYRTKQTRPGSPDGYSLDYTIAVPVSLSSPSAARSQPNGTHVGFPGTVSAVYQQCFYVQDPLRTGGMRVEIPDSGLAVGASVYVTGTMSANDDGERCLTSAAFALK